ncbi:Inhibitor of growth protein 4 [Schistosoma japonicum]|nr:Inhibitor of growth protein 4 [Schistosoma japonicum]KAH8875999.1 Inhibitor of growth protein 4 [Schistosoma japonicum]KAH8876000.1 Inhibitor of growth protein 4 [Schistosoma japonicum]KAH8876001.1 Inhibitor of growth protein 4 [Schistosoma japonicum]KAH8876002.1 Inhibitor of growth protein 4 [Schistosoma japonicum]
MSTPTRRIQKRHLNVHAPFKSPLKKISESSIFTHPNMNSQNIETKEQLDVTKSQSTINDSIKQTNRLQSEQQHLEKENVPFAEVNSDVNNNMDDEIEKCIDKLLSNRPNETCIDLEVELSRWRSRLHAYNEAKDSCIILFGLLANNRGCLVRELYSEFGMELDD